MSMKKKLFAATAAVALVGAITAGPASGAQSQDSTPGLTITAGTGPRFDTALANGVPLGLNAGDPVYPTVGDFSPVAMNGTPQLTSAVIDPFTVIDDSGTGAGWHVTLLVPDFQSGLNVLPAAGAQMNAAVVAQANPDSSMGGVWADPNHDFTTAKTIVEANPADTTHNLGAPNGPAGTPVAGMGTYLVSPQALKLVVPANAIAGAYTTTATIAIVNGP